MNWHCINKTELLYLLAQLTIFTLCVRSVIYSIKYMQ